MRPAKTVFIYGCEDSTGDLAFALRIRRHVKTVSVGSIAALRGRFAKQYPDLLIILCQPPQARKAFDCALSCGYRHSVVVVHSTGKECPQWASSIHSYWVDGRDRAAMFEAIDIGLARKRGPALETIAANMMHAEKAVRIA